MVFLVIVFKCFLLGRRLQRLKRSTRCRSCNTPSLSARMITKVRCWLGRVFLVGLRDRDCLRSGFGRKSWSLVISSRRIARFCAYNLSDSSIYKQDLSAVDNSTSTAGLVLIF